MLKITVDRKVIINVFKFQQWLLCWGPWHLAFANAFQATAIEGRLVGMNGVTIPYLYLGIFDGHGGAGCAIKERFFFSHFFPIVGIDGRFLNCSSNLQTYFGRNNKFLAQVSKELHAILHEGLEDVLPYMAFPEKMNSSATVTPNGSSNRNGMQGQIIWKMNYIYIRGIRV